MISKPLAIAYKPFIAMKTNTSKKRNFYTQGQRFAARILFILWLLASVSPEGTLATPKRQPAMTPATTTSPQGSSLASTPPTPPPGGILQLPPDSPCPPWDSSVASTPAIDAAPQPSSSLFPRTLDKLVGRLWSLKPQTAPKTPAGPIAEGVDSSPAAPADPAQDQASALTNKLRNLYQADDKLPKLIEDENIPEQNIDKYYVKLQAVVQEQGEYAESAAARDKVVGEKRAIQVHQLFDELAEGKKGEKPIGKVLLLGGAGIGKTTLMHHISHQWAKDRLWNGKYAYLFRVRLKELLNDSWKSDYTRDERDEHPLACFIDYCLRNQRIQLLESQAALERCNLAEIKNLLKDPASRHSVLLLVDGYDEIASQRQEGITKEIVHSILKRERVIMTSRPNAADQKLRTAFDRQVESQGLDRAGIDQYIDLQFGEEEAGQDLKDFLTKNRQILGMCEVPINTALLCIIWQDEEVREKLQAQSGEDLKLGELYEELVVWLGKRYMSKFEGENPEELPDQFILREHPIVKTLKEVAYRSFTGEGKDQSAGTLGIAGDRIDNTARGQGTKIEPVYQYGLLRAEGAEKELIKKTHYFIHLTFQEYLTALRFREALSQGEGVREVATHLANHRNEPRYLMTLKFLAGLVSELEGEKGAWAVQRFWEAVSCNVEGVLELGVASKVGLLMHLMAQSTTNGKLDERIPNREKLQELVDKELVKDLARWQEQLIASGYKSAVLVSKLCEVIYQEQPEDISALSAALEIGLALGNKVVEEEEQPLARRLEDLLDSPVWQVQALSAAKLAQVLDDTVDRAQVSRLLGKLIKLYEGANTARQAFLCIARLTELDQASVIEKLEKRMKQGSKGFSASDAKVRQSALELDTKLVEVFPALAQEFLEAAKRGFTDKERSMRSRAIDLMGQLVKSAPELAETILEEAKRRFTDKEWSVRSSALLLMGQLVERAPELAETILEEAKRGFTDQEGSVRLHALFLMGKLVERAPELAETILEEAKRWFTDQEGSVRSSALDLMGKLVESAPELAQGLLEAAKRRFTDKEWSVRSSALDLMGKLVERDAELAETILEEAKRGCKDKERYVRCSAFDLMGKLVESALELAETILEAAKRGFTDKAGYVRSSALDLMGKLVERAPELAETILEEAKRGFTDKARSVRSSALDLMGKLVERAPELAETILEEAKRGFTDKARSVRSSALDLMGKLVERAPELAETILEEAKRGFTDKEWSVRSRALDLMGKLVESAPELAETMLKAAKRGFTDKARSVRPRALDLMGKLVERAPELAETILEEAKRGCKDKEWSVRSSALDLMGKLVESAPELAETILEEAKRDLTDSDRSVRSRALDLMGQLVERAPELAETILEEAKRWFTDQEGDVRSSALLLMGQLVERAPELAETILEEAKRGFTDQEGDVRSSALFLMGKLVERAPELAETILEEAKRGFTDQEGDVRYSALDLMGKLVESAPELAETILEEAKRGFTDQEGDVRSRAFSLMGKLVESTPELAEPILEEAKRGFTDQEGDVRYSALDLMGKLVERAPELAETILEEAKRGFTDQEGDVRYSALDLMGKLVERAPELAETILEEAKRGFTDQEWYVRYSALDLMGKLVESAPELAEPILEEAKRGFTDQEEDVRSSALDLMGKLVESAPELAETILEEAKRGFTDQEEDVRSSALDLMGKLVESAPELAEPILEEAKRGFTDQEEDVRSSALGLMEKLLAIDAGLAQEFLEEAKRGFTDQVGDVRYSALDLMGKLLAIDAGLAPQFLEAAKTGVKDKDVNVRCAAFELLRKLAAALDKPEIARDALSQLKAQLEEETWRIKRSALETALTFTKRIPASAKHWLKLVPYGLQDEKSETQEAAISLGVELAFHLPGEAIISMLLQDPEPSVRARANTRFIKRLQDKTVTYSLQDVLVLDQLLQHNAAGSERDKDLQKAVTKKLLELASQVAKEAGLKYLNEHFDMLSRSTAIAAFLKKVMHQTLADNAIDQLEADFITKCILQHGITATIAPGKRGFVLEDSRYTLEDRPEANLQANLQHIVNSVIEKSESELARQYRAHQPLFLNTGLGLPIAASDIPTAGSIVNNADLTTKAWHLSSMHLSDHHKQAPQDTFLLLEQRNYVGEHIIKKITYDQGKYILAYDESINPNKALDTALREELFGPMEYERTKPRYYATYHTLSKKAAQELLGKINQQVGQDAQDAYQALHQLARKACEADQDAAGAEQLALEWRAYAQALEGLKKVDLLQLSQEDAIQVRQYSLTIAEREEIAALSKRFESLESILDVTGIASKAEIKEKLQALQESNPKLYDYCHTFIWTMSRYIAANGIASTDMFSQELEQSTKEAVGMGLVKAGMAAAESVPVIGDFADLLGNLIDAAYEGVKTAQQENKAAVLNRIIQDNHLFPEDADLTISRAGLQIAERKREEIEAGQAATKSILEKLLGIQIEDFKHTIEDLKHKMLRTYQIDPSPQANLAIEDVLTLLVRMYKEYETLNRQGGALYEQLAELVCMGSLSDLLSKSTEVTQKDIEQAESALESEIRKKKDTIGKLKRKAGEGFWEARWIKGGKECEQFFEEEHVKRYISDSQPGVEISDQQVVAMRMVLFRHMCKGIQESEEQSLACAEGFAAKYPALVQKLAKEHPHYFVSQAIARACITDQSLVDEVMSRLPN